MASNPPNTHRSLSRLTSAQILWSTEAAEQGLANLASRVATELAGCSAFCLWLEGPMGAGKTTTTRAILYALGLPSKVPVLSPTYTYMTEYQLPSGAWIAHLDLYRMPDLCSLEECGFDDRKNYRGVFVEWPPTSGGIFTPMLQPTHILSIGFSSDGLQRSYQLQKLHP